MVVEGIVTTTPELKDAYPEQFYSWEIYQYTQRDVEKAVDAFARLLDAIESRFPLMVSNQRNRAPILRLSD
jgi:broad specificity phosphatase PhoE